MGPVLLFGYNVVERDKRAHRAQQTCADSPRPASDPFEKPLYYRFPTPAVALLGVRPTAPATGPDRIQPHASK